MQFFWCILSQLSCISHKLYCLSAFFSTNIYWVPTVNEPQCWTLWLGVKFNLLSRTLKTFDDMASNCHSYTKSLNPASHTHRSPHPSFWTCLHGSPVPSPFYEFSIPFPSHWCQCPSLHSCRSHFPLPRSLVISSTRPALVSPYCIHSWMWSPTVQPPDILPPLCCGPYWYLLCILEIYEYSLMTFQALWWQGWYNSSICVFQWLAYVRCPSTHCVKEWNGHNFRPDFTSLCRPLWGTEDRGHW